HCKLDSSRATEINKLIKRGAHSSARVKHVVNQDNRAVCHIAWNVRSIDYGTRADRREVVAIKRDVELPGHRSCAFELRYFVRDSFGKRDTATANADQQQIIYPRVALDYFRSQPR